VIRKHVALTFIRECDSRDFGEIVSIFVIPCLSG